MVEIVDYFVVECGVVTIGNQGSGKVNRPGERQSVAVDATSAFAALAMEEDEENDEENDEDEEEADEEEDIDDGDEQDGEEEEESGKGDEAKENMPVVDEGLGEEDLEERSRVTPKIKSIVREYLNHLEVGEVEECMSELQTSARYYAILLEKGLAIVMEKKEPEQKAVTKLLIELHKRKVLSMAVIELGMLLEF